MTAANRSRGIALKDGMHAAFPTPLLVKRYGNDAVNRGVLEHVAAREAREATVGMSNVGGWHSSPDLLDAGDPPIVELRARVLKCLQAMLANASYSDIAADKRLRISAWANVARAGAYNAVHNHTPAVFSGVYYASIGDPAPDGSRDGLIEFIDPRPGPHGGPLPTHALHAPLVIDPEPGMLVIFPGWLLHFVHPYRGDTPRVSIAFNLWLDAPPAGA